MSELVDVLDSLYIDQFERRQLSPVIAVPTPLPAWNRCCRDDGGGIGIARGWFIGIGGTTKSGKALGVDTPIPTASGWALMGDLQVGDSVFAGDGTPTKIVAVTDWQLDRPCFLVSFADGETIIADAEHEWVTYLRDHNGGKSKGIRTTLQIADSVMLGSRYAHTVDVGDELVGVWADLPVDPYVLGAWLGDGTSAVAQITLNDGDAPEILAHIRAAGENVTKLKAPLLWSLGGPVPGRGLLVHRLDALGVRRNKRIPGQYLRSSISQRASLLQGLMDTDGYCDRKGRCEIVTVIGGLAGDISELLSSLGFRHSVSESRALLNGKDCGPRWRIHFTPYANRPVFRLRRKLVNQKPFPEGGHWQKSMRKAIVAVDPCPSVPVRCIQVADPSGTFRAGRKMTVTHNSLLALNLAESAISVGETVGFVSLEMSVQQLTARYLSIASGVPVRSLEKGSDFSAQSLRWAYEGPKERFLAGIVDGKRATMLVNTEPLGSTEAVWVTMARMREAGCTFFVVDYLQLVGAGDEEEMVRRVFEVANALRLFCREYEVTIVGLSQYNRKTSSDYTQSPIPQSLQGGSIENGVDQVLLLDHSRYERDENHPHLARTWLILGANRHGESGDIPVLWSYDTLRIRQGMPDEEREWPMHGRRK